MSHFYAIYFSATDTTRHCVASFCQGIGRNLDAAINFADDFNVSFPDITAEDAYTYAQKVRGIIPVFPIRLSA